MSHNLFIENIIKGDRIALEVFVNENRSNVFRICMAYVQNEADATDLTQEVFIKALEKIHQYKGNSKLSTWLIRIAINISLNFLRDNKKRMQHLDVSELQLVSESKDELTVKETKANVRKAIFNLPENQRKVFILSFYLDLSYVEISEATGQSISSVESLLFRARKNLRENLTEYYNKNQT